MLKKENCNIKKYIVWSLIGFSASYGLVILSALGFFPISKIFFGIISIIILTAVFWKTKEFFWLFLVVLPLENIVISGNYLPFSLRPFQLVGGALIVVLLIKFIFYKKYRQKINYKKWDILVLLLPAFSLLGLINAPNKSVVVKQTVILSSFVLLYLVARYFFRKRKDLFEAIWFFIVSSDVVILFGLYQAIARKVGWKSFEVMDGRINSTFAEPDWLAMYAVVLAAIVFFLKIALPKLRKNIMVGCWSFRETINFILNFYLFFIFWVLFLTVARSGWIAFAMLAIFYLVLKIFTSKNVLGTKKNLNYKLQITNYKNILKEGFIILVIIVLVILITEITNLSSFHFANRAGSSLSGMQKITVSCRQGAEPPVKITSVDELRQYGCRHINLEEKKKEKMEGNEIKEIYRPDPNVNIRKDIYQISWQQIKKHPIIGHGLGSSSLFLGQDQRGAGLNTSNIFLESWISFGIFGLLIIIILFFYPFILAIKKIIQGGKEGAALFIILTAVTVLIPNLFNAGLLLGFFWIWLAVIGSIKKVH